MRGNASKYPDKQVSAASAKAQLSMLLNGCTDERLSSFTVDGLGKMYRVPMHEIQTMLTVARMQRA
jgi:hypothetical protein